MGLRPFLPWSHHLFHIVNRRFNTLSTWKRIFLIFHSAIVFFHLLFNCHTLFVKPRLLLMHISFFFHSSNTSGMMQVNRHTNKNRVWNGYYHRLGLSRICLTQQQCSVFFFFLRPHVWVPIWISMTPQTLMNRTRYYWLNPPSGLKLLLLQCQHCARWMFFCLQIF